ncbi:hypothetical protein BaRGS_00013234, partial [Batillaria attramentaria]
IVDGADSSGPVLAEFCGTGIPDPIVSSGSSLRVTLFSTSNAVGNKFSASWTTVCQKTLTTESGVVTSPLYPSDYPTDVDCTYVIEQNPGKQIELTFTSFNMADMTDSQCTDFVEIRNGGSALSPLVGNLCGTSLPPRVTSTQNVLWIKFHSDDNTNAGRNGFSASFVAVTPVCSSPSLTGNEGSFTSPGYPQPYPGYTTCQWTITVEPGLRIELTFDTMAIYGWGRNCNYGHYVKMYDSNTVDDNTLIDTYCGATVVPPVRSTGNVMTVVFQSGYYSSWWYTYYNFNGFSAFYTSFDPSDLFLFGLAQGDTELQFNGNNDAKHITLDLGIPFGNALEKNIHIGSNGVVSFGSRYTYPYLSWYRKMVCVYASYIDNSVYNGEGDRDEEVLTKATDEVREFTESDTFQASLVLVVTAGPIQSEMCFALIERRDVFRPYRAGPIQREMCFALIELVQSKVTSAGEATFQAAFITDGSSSYVLIYYKSGAMGWQNRRRWPYVVMGISMGTGDWADVQQSFYSYKDEAYSIDKIKGNTGRLGMWIYQLGEGVSNPEQACLTWFLKNIRLQAQRSQGFAGLPQCPCSLRDVWRRTRFTWRTSRYDYENRVYCYRLTRSASRRVAPFGKSSVIVPYGSVVVVPYRSVVIVPYGSVVVPYGSVVVVPYGSVVVVPYGSVVVVPYGSVVVVPYGSAVVVPYGSVVVVPYGSVVECCYSWDWRNQATYQKLIVGPPLAGAAQAYNPDSYSQRDKHVTEDRNPHDWCCKQSDLAGFCELYYIVRPVGQCRDKIPFRFSWMFGDPHIETLDGRQYTFNGLGEYTLVTFANFTLQGRTALAKTNSGTPTNATVFTAFGAEENNIRVFVGLDPSTNNTMEIYANGTDYSLRFRQEEDLEVDTDDFYLARDNNSLVVAFPSQISLSVSVGLSSLDMSVTIPEEFKGQPSGLMGNYNDDDTDDFVLADGTTLSNTLSERQLYDQFGTKWAINETASVMRYGQKKGPADYADPDFIPLFLDEQPDDVRQAAENQCGGSANLACIYDYVATGSQAFATASKQTAETVNATEAQSSNVSVTSGVTQVISITGSDADSDPLTYRLVDNASGALQINSSTGDITVALTTTQQNSIRVYAEDSQGAQSPVLVIAVQMCSGCNGRGQCDFGRGQVSLDDPNFQTAPCVCHPAYTGQDCQDELDACLNNPCLQDQVCVDLSPDEQGDSEVGYNCTGCPDGYTYDSGVCVDVDECNDTELNTCDTLCTNTGGSFTCSCNQGYRLLSDQRTCFDVDECADRTHNCQQICENTAGGFNCSCQDGYTLDPVSGTQCEQTDAATAACDGFNCTQGCQTAVDAGWKGSICQIDVNECEETPGICGESQVCVNNNGSYSCRCADGYTKNNESKCEDVDECGEGSVLNACGELEKCNNVPGSFYCTCNSGYKRSENTNCTDVDECTDTNNICQHVCVNVEGTYNCECNYGYRLNEDRATCYKVEDVCAELENLNCDHGCTLDDDTNQGVCFCNTGYTLQNDGQTCQDVDECALDTDGCSDNCTNTAGGFQCSCPVGKVLDNDKKTCIDCPQGTYGKDCSFTCGCGIGSERCDVITGCVCRDGWTGAKCDRDVIDCDVESVRQQCQDKNAECRDVPGSYTCQCPEGYAEDETGACQDEDECVGTQSPCSQTCENTAGSYRCLCNQGFQLDHGSTDTCDVNLVAYIPQGRIGVSENVDECALTATNPCTQRCDNTLGAYICSCDVIGYVLDDDRATCIPKTSCGRTDCDSVNGGCAVDGALEICFCNSGYTLDPADNITCTFIDVDWCAVAGCQHVCTEIDDGKSYMCSCNDGYLINTDQQTCRDVDECGENSDGCDHNCTNNLGSFVCTCRDGFSLQADQKTCKACLESTYGPECRGRCDCLPDNTHSCDPATGTCICKRGLKGAICQDEDEADPCTTGRARNFTAVCVGIAKLKFEVRISVDIDFDDTNPDSASYILVATQVRVTLLRRFLRKQSGVLDINIIAIRKGSLIVEAEAAVTETSKEEAANWLVGELQAVEGDNLTIGNQTGAATVPVFGTSVCAEEEECQREDDGQATCRALDSEDDSWKLIVGLAVSIPLVFLLFGLALLYCHRRRREKDDSDSISSDRISRDDISTAGSKIHRSRDDDLEPHPWGRNLGTAWRHSYSDRSE